MIYLAVCYTSDFDGGDIYVSSSTTDSGVSNGLCLVFSTMSLVDQFVVSRVFNNVSQSWPVCCSLSLSSPFPAQLLWQNRDLQTSRHLLKRNCFPSELLNHIPLKSHSFEFITFLCLLISNWRFHKMHWRKSQSEEISLILLILSRSERGKNCSPAASNNGENSFMGRTVARNHYQRSRVHFSWSVSSWLCKRGCL